MGRIVDQKRSLFPKQVWAIIRARLELAGSLRDLAKLAVTDLVKDDRVRERVSVIQRKNRRPFQFELNENTRLPFSHRLSRRR